jgi:GTP-binding protein HflX
VVGSGKLAELVALAAETAAAPIEAVLVDHDITPSQARNLEKATGVEVLDRTAVILEIFRRHARSRAAKAQVEIVRLQYLVPRLREQGRDKGRTASAAASAARARANPASSSTGARSATASPS